MSALSSAILSTLIPLLIIVLWLRFKRNSEKVIVVVLGSGGHTNEMFRLLLNTKIPTNRELVFVVGKDDLLSEKKLELWQAKCAAATIKPRLYRVTRPRKVHQTMWTAIPCAFVSLLECIRVMLRERPEIVLTNGPALCVVASLAARLCSMSLKAPWIVYVESFARVYSLSMSGKAMQYMTNKFVVQWPELAAKGTRFTTPRLYGSGPLV